MKINDKQTKFIGGGYPIIFFLSTWLLLSFYYGDVLYIAQQNSFFSSESLNMDYVTGHRPYGYLWWLGRAMLQLFHYPWLGGAATALLLTLISGLTAYVFRLKGKLFLLRYVPAWAWMAYSFYKGYDLYYQTETGQILGIPICIFIILLLQAGFMRTFSKKKVASSFTEKTKSLKLWLAELIIMLLVPAGLIMANETMRPYVRPTAHMQCALQNEDWQEMIRTAKESKLAARPIATYYAIALMQTSSITQALFDIDYDFQELHLHNRNGKQDNGTSYYEAEGNFYAGLILTAYKNAMESLTMEGPTIANLKLLTEAALLNDEPELCKKYLRILETLPFEQDFIEQIQPYLANKEAINQNPRYANILKLRPVGDSFETTYRKPLFLGYNVSLMQGRSFDALQASLAACLYSKSMDAFLVRTEPMVNTVLPQNVQDALVMESAKNNQINQVFRLDQFARSRYDMFLNNAAAFRGNREEGAKALKEQYIGYYPYYYFFGNISSEAKTEDDTNQKQEHSGVN